MDLRLAIKKRVKGNNWTMKGIFSRMKGRLSNQNRMEGSM